MNKFIASLAGLAFSVQASAATDLSVNVRVNNKVGMDLARAVNELNLQDGKIENTMVSPISAYAAFSMLQAGLKGNTQNDLNQFLGLDSRSALTLHKNNKLFFDSLRVESQRVPGVTHPQQPIIGLYNSAWATNGQTSGFRLDFNPSMINTLKSYYDAEIQSIDFTQETSANSVNAWANQKTRGMIPSVIKPDVMRSLQWILMNATYVEANWALEFRPLPSVHAPKFNLLDGQTKQFDSIIGTKAMRTAETAELDIVEVPFYASDLAFYVLQPKSVDLFKTMLADGRLHFQSTWENAFALLKTPTRPNADVRLVIPKFAFPYSITMRKGDALVQKLALNSLYEDRSALDFSPLGLLKTAAGQSEPTVVGLIKQDSKIELDENGVKAAAVTLIGGVRTTSVDRPRPIIDFIVDKPFQFVIASKTTGAVLFVGTVVSPK